MISFHAKFHDAKSPFSSPFTISEKQNHSKITIKQLPTIFDFMITAVATVYYWLVQTSIPTRVVYRLPYVGLYRHVLRLYRRERAESELQLCV